jgi:hypothetical protein
MEARDMFVILILMDEVLSENVPLTELTKLTVTAKLPIPLLVV